jgi:hypothetical protein
VYDYSIQHPLSFFLKAFYNLVYFLKKKKHQILDVGGTEPGKGVIISNM